MQSDKQSSMFPNLFSELEMRIRDVREGPDGLLYILTDEGSFIRVKPAT